MATVQLNVGGQAFTTTLDTLLKEPSCRLALLARGVLPGLTPDSSAACFIDRDPRHFQLLLNYLRDGWCSLPTSPEGRAEVAQEAKAYGLSSMLAWMRTQETSPSPGGLPATAPGSAGKAGAFLTSPTAHFASPVASQQQHSALMSQYLAHLTHPASTAPSATTTGLSAPATIQSAAASPAGMLASSPALPQRGAGLRQAFLAATAPLPAPVLAPTPAVPSPQVGRHGPGSMPLSLPGTPSKWTAKCLTSNEPVRQAVNSLLELGFVAPHPALCTGRVHVSITPGPCQHGQPDSLPTTAPVLAPHQLQVHVECPATGWSCSFPVRAPPGASSGTALQDQATSHHAKFGQLPALVQDNWFVMTGVLKDNFGILMEDAQPMQLHDTSLAGHRGKACAMCRRLVLAVTLTKVI